MLQLILAVLCGCGAAVFGMWAFLKGQASMMDAQAGARPGLFGPVCRPKRGGPDLASQLRSMVSPGPKGDE